LRSVSIGCQVPFFGGVPEPAIVMYPNAIVALVSTVTLHGSHEHEWPNALHDLIVGRVLGRALAHEIGHVLLRSSGHAAEGLMRAQHLVPDLVAADRRRFVLSESEVMRLVMGHAELTVRSCAGSDS
jgi:hypothetical protein